MEQQSMESNLYPSDYVEYTILDNVTRFQSSAEEIPTRVAYDFNPSETFSGADIPGSTIQSYINEFNESFVFDNIPMTIQPITTNNSVTEVYEFLKVSAEGFHPIESNDTAYQIQNDDELGMLKASNGTLPAIRSNIEKPSKGSIPLSNSVAVTDPQPRKLHLVYPLEDTYRPRYKSDYFPQHGPVRRPRYIADNAANHFITLQIPTDYRGDLKNKYIRVALITTLIDNQAHYYSPYKFQTDHNDIKVPDENPVYKLVETNQDANFIVRLHLVLIKSKLDQLNYVQPLKPFCDTTTHIQNIIHDESLTPKELINKYQLDKSRIAFTLCTKDSDGTYKPHPETTIISSVITEVSISKKINESTSTQSVDPNKNIRCPNCSHCFDRDAASGLESEKKRKSNDETSYNSAKTIKPKNYTDRKKKNV